MHHPSTDEYTIPPSVSRRSRAHERTHARIERRGGHARRASDIHGTADRNCSAGAHTRNHFPIGRKVPPSLFCSSVSWPAVYCTGLSEKIGARLQEKRENSTRAARGQTVRVELRTNALTLLENKNVLD